MWVKFIGDRDYLKRGLSSVTSLSLVPSKLILVFKWKKVEGGPTIPEFQRLLLAPNRIKKKEEEEEITLRGKNCLKCLEDFMW